MKTYVQVIRTRLTNSTPKEGKCFRVEKEWDTFRTIRTIKRQRNKGYIYESFRK